MSSLPVSLVVLLLLVPLPSRGQDCPSGYYFDKFASRCCWQCGDGEGAQQRCTNTSDTVCIHCPETTFSAVTPTGRSCQQCTVCGPSRITITPCSATQDSECGTCSAGWFMLVSTTGNQCLKCSPCPPGEVVIHWSECKEVGLPEEYQCMPGLYNHSGPLPTDRGGFIPQRNDGNDDILSDVPTDSLPVVIITAVALVAGSLSAVFFCIVFVLVSWRICKQERRNYFTHRPTDSELQPLDTSETD